ncbi:MAG TPA: PhzF family phenazine biosynthesis protein [Fimbriimonadaceae bacterium]|nr:PhzF family phenazine biosynthesis protein [Fimbriimonadaceae bacterium]
MRAPIFVVDAFASRPFTGNPAGVCLLDEPADEDWMQRVAAEMKHAETAFLVPNSGGFGLRWFTPAAEVDLCGHATLASAHVLWETGCLGDHDEAVFHTKSGELRCTRHGYGIQMDFPAEPLSGAEPANAAAILAALGLGARFVSANRMDVLVEAPTAEALRTLRPDMDALASLGGRGFIVTCASDSDEFDFLSRFFAPAVGVPEDPVTGSAHCCLGPYWAAKLGKSDLSAFQCSARGGTVRVAVRGDRVLLQGHAVTVLAGELTA